MEIFLIFLVITYMIVSISLLVYIANMTKSFCDVLYDRSGLIIDEVQETNRSIRSMQALKDSQEAAKPIRTNNWDSMREAFKGPVRVEINERN